jgi:hypothetical protein
MLGHTRKGDAAVKKIVIFMFIDAMGWEIVKDRQFLEDLLPYRRPVQMQFGYSCTAIPTILTGERPRVHKHLSFYYYAPDKSPFTLFRYLGLGLLPRSITDRWRVRHQLSKLLKKFYGYTGYFELYAMPFDRLPYFDYIEKTDLFVPGGLHPVKNLADTLEERGIPYHISNWRLTEEENIRALLRDVEKGEIRFAFLYTAAMDALLHRVTKNGPEVDQKLDWYAEQIRGLLKSVEGSYQEIHLSVFSDHGMTTLTGVVDVQRQVEGEGLRFGKDFVATYDATMARIWFVTPQARAILMDVLETIPHSHVVTSEEKIRHGIDFEDHMYGDEILLMDPGWQIEPCDMGLKALPGMHGFAPEHEDSYAAILSSEPLTMPLDSVADYFRLMVSKMA